jgi:hypothetical protein
METYNEGDKVRVKATGQRGTVRSKSQPARHSVGMEPSQETGLVEVQIDGTEELRPFLHEEIEAAEPEKDVQPEPKG